MEEKNRTLVTVATLDLAIVSRQRTLLAEMTHLVAVAACDGGWIARLVTLLAHMALFATVAASIASASRAILGEMTHCENISDILEKRQGTYFGCTCGTRLPLQNVARCIRRRYDQTACTVSVNGIMRSHWPPRTCNYGRRTCQPWE